MKLLVRVGAIATLNLLCCSIFPASANVASNIKLQSNFYEKNVLNKKITQRITPPSFNNRFQSREINTQFANFLPSNAPLVAMLDTSSASWKKAGNFQLFQTAWNGISSLIPSIVKIGYATEIEPWLGEQVAFAFLPKDGASRATIQSNFVMLAPVTDEQALQSFLSKLKANGGFNQRKYKGITILETKTAIPKSPLN